MGEQKKNQMNKEVIDQVRLKIREVLAACDQAEAGLITAEEFEKKISKCGVIPDGR